MSKTPLQPGDEVTIPGLRYSERVDGVVVRSNEFTSTVRGPDGIDRTYGNSAIERRG